MQKNENPMVWGKEVNPPTGLDPKFVRSWAGCWYFGVIGKKPEEVLWEAMTQALCAGQAVRAERLGKKEVFRVSNVSGTVRVDKILPE